VLTLKDVLHRINEAVDDFASHPATSPMDKGAFDDYPLHKVAIWGDVEAAQVLLAHGADINAAGEDNDTPLHRAIAARQAEMVDFLLSRGADVDVRDRYGWSPRDSAEISEDPAVAKAMRSHLNRCADHSG
jgi:ankyrin repeat protein